MSARELILVAARAHATDWGETTMGQLAQQAGVSRQSVYNEFGSKHGVAEALVARELDAFLIEIDTQIAAGTSPSDSVDRACRTVFAMAAENPVVNAAITAAGGNPSPLLPLITSASLIDAVVQRADAALAAQYGAANRREVLDAVVRLVISHIVNPGGPPDMSFVTARLLA